MKAKYTAIVLSIISLVISLAIVGLWFWQKNELSIVDSNSYIAAIVSALAIIVTFVVGWQIYNVLDYKRKVAIIDELQNQLKTKNDELDTKIKDINYDLDYMSLQITAGTFVEQKCYAAAFLAYTRALVSRLNKSNIREEMEYISFILSDMKNCSTKIFTIDKEVIEKIKEKDAEIRSLENFLFVEKEYEVIYNKMLETQREA